MAARWRTHSPAAISWPEAGMPSGDNLIWIDLETSAAISKDLGSDAYQAREARNAAIVAAEATSGDVTASPSAVPN